MPSASPSSQCGRRGHVSPPAGASAPTSPTSGWSCGSDLAPGPDRDVRLLATDRDVGVGRVGDAQQQVVELGLGLRQLGVERRDARAGGARGGAQVGDLGAVGRGAAP